MTRHDAIKKLTQLKNKFLDEYIDYDGTTSAYDMAIEALKEPEPITLTYDEKCIFLSAIWKERYLCQKMDEECEDSEVKAKLLVPIVDEIKRKVMAVLWGENDG